MSLFKSNFFTKIVGGKSISDFISAHLTEVPEGYIVAEVDRPPSFSQEEDIELMNDKRRWTYISSKIHTENCSVSHITPQNAVNNINQGMEPDIEGQDPLVLYDPFHLIL